MGQIIKRGGKKQAFSATKIRKAIQKAAKDAKFSPAKTKEVVRNVGEAVIKYYKNKKAVKSVDVRKAILGRLDRGVKPVAFVWRKFEKKRRK